MRFGNLGQLYNFTGGIRLKPGLQLAFVSELVFPPTQQHMGSVRVIYKKKKKNK